MSKALSALDKVEGVMYHELHNETNKLRYAIYRP